MLICVIVNAGEFIAGCYTCVCTWKGLLYKHKVDLLWIKQSTL